MSEPEIIATYIRHVNFIYESNIKKYQLSPIKPLLGRPQGQPVLIRHVSQPQQSLCNIGRVFQDK